MQFNWVELDENLVTVERPLRFFGLPLGTRMTFLRLANGQIWVHSAFDPGLELRRRMDELGPVSHLVCPNRMHHLYVGDLLAHYPEAALYLSYGLPSKRPDLGHGKVLGDIGPAEWLPDLEHHCLRGNLFLDECVFFHRPSRTLILTDLLWGCRDSYPWYLRGLIKMSGGKSGLAPPPEMRVLFHPRQVARQSIETILQWDFERIVTAHGPIVEENGEHVFRRAFSFLLK